MIAVLLCAGYATRMYPLTVDFSIVRRRNTAMVRIRRAVRRETYP